MDDNVYTEKKNLSKQQTNAEMLTIATIWL